MDAPPPAPTPTPVAAKERWIAPVRPARVTRRFRLGEPYAAGNHRGIDLASRPGQRVVSPCAGTVTFVGRVAGSPPTITIDCGQLRATIQRATPRVSSGASVERGAPLGVAVAQQIDLSARDLSGRYVDPASLLEIGAPPTPAMPPVTAPRSRRVRPQPVPEPVRLPHSVVAGELARPSAAAGGAASADLPVGFAGAALGLWGMLYAGFRWLRRVTPAGEEAAAGREAADGDAPRAIA